MLKPELGKLYGIGIGPGDPELITVKALKRIQQTTVVAFPVKAQGMTTGVARECVAEWLLPHHVELPLVFPFVQDFEVMYPAWQHSADRIWQVLSQGTDVVFISEGDVSFFSTFTYLAQVLQQAHPEAQIEVVPGVSSPMAAAAMLGIPLAIWNQRVKLLPAIHSVSELETALTQAEVVVLMKMSSIYQHVWTLLKRLNLLDYSYVVERATFSDQKLYRGLSDRPDLQLSYFSILIVYTQRIHPETVVFGLGQPGNL